MDKYHKIQTIFHRDPDTKFKTLIMEKFSCPEFEYLYKNRWRWDEKIDGTNVRLKNSSHGKWINFYGKTDNADLHSDLIDFLHSKFRDESTYDKFEGLFSDSTNEVCLYGEGIGPKIQSNKYKRGYDFILFDVNISNWWLKREDVEHIAKELGITIAPIVGIGTLEEMIHFIEKGFQSKIGPCVAEGIVARPLVELRARSGDRIITKLKYKDFNRGKRK